LVGIEIRRVEVELTLFDGTVRGNDELRFDREDVAQGIERIEIERIGHRDHEGAPALGDGDDPESNSGVGGDARMATAGFTSRLFQIHVIHSLHFPRGSGQWSRR
jgi:hypothetical protein